jgi:hypothetical protein
VYDLSRQKITFLGHCLDARIIDADQKGWKRAINAARKYRSPRSTEEFIQARSELLGIGPCTKTAVIFANRTFPK